jgi:hypothetical protein
MEIEVKKGQCLFDIAMQYCGNAELAWDIATLNQMSLTDNLAPGQILKIPEPNEKFNKMIIRKLADLKISPATAVTDDFINELDDPGIGEMIIEKTFVVR